jgi:uncharacterized membrane protein YheB (UPF0754 family)
MRLTKTQLKQIIKEEMQKALNEDMFEILKYKDLICKYRNIILLGLDKPDMARYLAEKLIPAEYNVLIKAIEAIAGVKVQDILKNPIVKETIKTALNTVCP